MAKKKIKLSQNFCLQEMVDPHTIDTFGGDAVMFLDPDLPNLAEAVRYVFSRHLGKTVGLRINDWFFGGKFRYRGFRGKLWKKSRLSQHCLGRGLDITAWDNSLTGDQMRKIMTDYLTKYMKHDTEIPINYRRALERVSFIEDGVSWLHIDMRTRGSSWRGKALKVWHVTTKKNRFFTY